MKKTIKLLLLTIAVISLLAMTGCAFNFNNQEFVDPAPRIEDFFKPNGDSSFAKLKIESVNEQLYISAKNNPHASSFILLDAEVEEDIYGYIKKGSKIRVPVVIPVDVDAGENAADKREAYVNFLSGYEYLIAYIWRDETSIAPIYKADSLEEVSFDNMVYWHRLSGHDILPIKDGRTDIAGLSEFIDSVDISWLSPDSILGFEDALSDKTFAEVKENMLKVYKKQLTERPIKYLTDISVISTDLEGFELEVDIQSELKYLSFTAKNSSGAHITFTEELPAIEKNGEWSEEGFVKEKFYEYYADKGTDYARSKDSDYEESDFILKTEKLFEPVQKTNSEGFEYYVDLSGKYRIRLKAELDWYEPENKTGVEEFYIDVIIDLQNRYKQ